MKFTRYLCLALAVLLLLSTLAGCADNDNKKPTDTKPTTDDGTTDEIQQALDALGTIDWAASNDGNKDFTVLYADRCKEEVVGINGTVDKDGGSSQVINDAVYERNTLLEERCNLKYNVIEREYSSIANTVSKESNTGTGDFQLIDTMTGDQAGMATNRYLYDYLALDVDVDQPWWDSGTADFCLNDAIYFMSGSINFGDDNVTYVLIFNKDMLKSYPTIENPYQTVRDWKWTLAYFNEVIQGISADDGDGKWDENDTYGFVTTWEYGSTFFFGSDLRLVLNDRNSVQPELYLADKGRMDRALNVLDLSKQIYHNNNATYMSPPGEEAKGQSCFKDGRGLFFGEVAQNLADLNKDTQFTYGVLPVPKYDERQEFYRTWTHGVGSSYSVVSAIPDAQTETVGNVLEAMAILSHQKIKPAYYDKMLTSRNIRDEESAEMLDLIFQNRIYDMAMYFDLGLGDIFKTSVNANDDKFSSSYKQASSRFSNKIKNILKKLN